MQVQLACVEDSDNAFFVRFQREIILSVLHSIHGLFLTFEVGTDSGNRHRTSVRSNNPMNCALLRLHGVFLTDSRTLETHHYNTFSIRADLYNSVAFMKTTLERFVAVAIAIVIIIFNLPFLDIAFKNKLKSLFIRGATNLARHTPLVDPHELREHDTSLTINSIVNVRRRRYVIHRGCG